MTKSLLISMLKQGSNGNEILSILDTIVSDSVSDADSVPMIYCESPMIEQILGIPTSEEIAF